MACLLTLGVTGTILASNKDDEHITPTTTYIQTSEHITKAIETTTQVITTTEPTTVTTQVATTAKPTTTVAETKESPVYDDVELIALVTVAEAEGESEYGKRLVIDTILNRVDSKHFPDTIYGVIYQPNQFTSMTNGRVDRCVVTDDVRQLVREEMESRTNSEVIFFRTGHYSPYGTPLFQEGSHYFNKY